MINIYLLGKHSTRTVFAYDVYQSHLEKYFKYVDDPTQADILVSGYVRDIYDNKDYLLSAYKNRQEIKVLILSEEPLWDTTNNMTFIDFFKRDHMLSIGSLKINVTFLNHFNSQIFDFSELPYYISTNNDFWLRYSYLYKRNMKFNENDFKSIFNNSLNKYVFFNEKRTEKSKYDKKYKRNVQGLAYLRTQLASHYFDKGQMVVGKGWKNSNDRQQLPDWHLDKICQLDTSSRIVSAVENTHVNNYVTEKVFDSFAVVAIPIYCASNEHMVNTIVEKNSYINIYDKTVEESIREIESFKINDCFLSNYIESQKNLYKIFSNTDNLHRTRSNTASKVIYEVHNIMNNDL